MTQSFLMLLTLTLYLSLFLICSYIPSILLYLTSLLLIFLAFLVPLDVYNFLRHLDNDRKNCKFTLIFSLKYPNTNLKDPIDIIPLTMGLTTLTTNLQSKGKK